MAYQPSKAQRLKAKKELKRTKEIEAQSYGGQLLDTRADIKDILLNWPLWAQKSMAFDPYCFYLETKYRLRAFKRLIQEHEELQELLEEIKLIFKKRARELYWLNPTAVNHAIEKYGVIIDDDLKAEKEIDRDLIRQRIDVQRKNNELQEQGIAQPIFKVYKECRHLEANCLPKSE